MFETAFALGLTQFARSLSLPERVRHRTARNAALEPWRLRNTGLDALYYDVKALTSDETFYISDSLASEGLIMIVPPTGGPMLTICDSVEEYRLRGGRDVHALAVAGMGGSAIGAAAFARNVANAIGEPVAAVVSGYGLGDIVNEAIAGAFLFGWLGHIRSNLEVIDDVVGRPKLGAYGKRDEDGDGKKSRGLDADTVTSLLADPSFSFTLIAGHSRGNRVIADALHALKASDPARLELLANTARIVTFGGRIKMPDAFADITDVVGELDWFGELNSRPKIATDIRVPFCGHSTNTDMPGAIKVTKIITDILAGHIVQAPEPQAEETAEASVSVPSATALAAPDQATRALVEQPLPVMAAPVVELAEPVAEETSEVTIEATTATEAAPTPASDAAVAMEAATEAQPDIPLTSKPEETAPTAARKAPLKSGPKKSRTRR
ncbi:MULTISPECIES: cell envelope biogenesis protein OmpA [unclassified Rhizobium]|uniref:cell envelope biogenesis protein OmpA n=1 Tax=unclassified Rhizobium TaxID=2613769 RepID=UPI000A947C60|nr:MULTISPECIES: cell envelope biogenesis protein OmpA [unclassified Rhizobium]